MLLKQVHFTQMRMLPSEVCHADRRTDDRDRTTQVSQSDESALHSSQAPRTESTADRNARGDRLTSQEPHSSHACSQPGAQKAPEGTLTHLWPRGRAGGGAGVGK